MQSVTSKSADRLRVINSRTGEVVTSDVHVAGAEDVELAAFENRPWSTMSGSRRGKLLWKLADLMEANGAELAGLESLAMGAFPILGQAVVIKNAADVFRC
ncbi:unnamed protein product [Clonostachys chloroleuca]|uniref:Aldehyde dehydrogenase domain-containing protein n=1 Tax=Clonostachys chloroleuca TaxID=1926264 RepID=A0AA35MFS3_9HYPO|nr:unnamed protein product [Clonostachys chloroleuca]